MAVPSIPVYVDPPNWPPQLRDQERVVEGGGGAVVSISDEAPQLPQQAPASHGGPGYVSRPNSMTERARMAKIPMPEPGLKCPRCDSTNTKFCYFNNYSLTQPRHFCKACRRYWTRGGVLRNVPVGGGCRRNKRSKTSNRSKHPAVTGQASAGLTTSRVCGGISATSSTCSAASMTAAVFHCQGHSLPLSGHSQLLSVLPPLHNLNDYIPNNIGSGFDSSRRIGGTDIEFRTGDTTGGVDSVLPNGLADQQWRLQQFSLFGSNNFQAAPQIGFYTALQVERGTSDDQELVSISKPLEHAQIPPVKVKEHNRGLDLSNDGFSDIPGTGQLWQGLGVIGTSNAWGSDLSSHDLSSSASHLL